MPPRKPTERSIRLADDIGRLVGQCRRQLWLAAASGLEERGVARESIVAMQLLTRLMSKPMTQTELATATGQHAAGISRVLEELEGRGLVERQRDARDRRRQIVEATAEGRAHWKGLHPQLTLAMEAELQVLTQTERETLRELLAKLAAAGEATS